MTTALQEAAMFLDNEIVIPLRQYTMARKLITLKPKVKGDGIKSAKILKLIEMGKAQVEYSLPKEMSGDMVRIDKSTVDIPILFKSYEIDRAEMNAFSRDGIAIDTSAAISAAQVIGEKEDDVIIQGWDPLGDASYEMKGLYQGAGLSITDEYSFGTYGKAKQVVSLGQAALEEKHVRPPFNLVLNPVQHGELVTSEPTGGGIREYDTVLKILNGNSDGGPGRIFSTPDIVAGTGLISPVDPGRVYMELLNPQLLRNVLGEDSKMPGIGAISGTAFEALYVNIKHENALLKMTVI
jgi:uncharacterized linocin/CFP29 family protein